MNDKISRILEAAIQAPSGDNCQPWRLVVNDQQLDIFNLSERDQSLYNYLQRASFVAHGAMLENLTLAASKEGYTASISLFPDPQQPDLVAQVDLIGGECKPESLASAIFGRCTQRGRFQSGELTNDQSSKLLSCSNGFSGSRVVLSQTPAERQRLAALVSRNDWLVFENRPLHRFFFDQIRWTQEDAQRTRDGLDVGTLGLGRVDRLAFTFLRHWPLVYSLNTVGLARMVSRKAEQVCRNAAAIGAVIVSGSKAEDYILGGRVMQRVWLQATSLGLQFQPYAGISFLMQQVREGGGNELTDSSRKVIRQVNAEFQQSVSLGTDVVVMFFRIGHGQPPARRSLRNKLDDVLTIAS